MKIALVHDWLTGMRGGEKCLDALCELYPEAEIFTLVHIPGTVSESIERLKIHTSFIQKLPFVRKKYRSYLPLFPAAIEQFDLRKFDLVISTSHCVAKGVIPRPDAIHICYCHTPMRYVWAMYNEYFGPDRVSGLSKWLIPYFANYLRMWDVSSSPRVDYFISNSHHVRKRIRRYYLREADVIYPPIHTGHTSLSASGGDYFLMVTAFAPYKRVDLAVECFNRLGDKLLIIGTGQDEKRLRRMAKSNIEFIGWVNAEDLGEYYGNCKALIFPGEEDFGIVPVEAQCYGKPVIAYGCGGALETVKGIWSGDSAESKGKNHTGIFFPRQTVASLMKAIEAFKEKEFDPRFIRKHALTFDRSIYLEKMKLFIDQKLKERKP